MLDNSPAAERNRAPIADAIADELPSEGLVLEIASGGGEHVVYLADRFPALEWQPTDHAPEAIATINARLTESEYTNIRPPISLDAALSQWPVREAVAILCINMVHISPWAATTGLFEGAAKLLAKGAPLILYGPYLENEVETAISNMSFDESLRSRDPRWGIRPREELDKLAARTGFQRTRRIEMPANNLVLVYRRA